MIIQDILSQSEEERYLDVAMDVAFLQGMVNNLMKTEWI